jgi:hypothetical protein
MTPCTGFGGACMLYAEMNGLQAVHCTAVTESHYVTMEALQAYESFLTTDLSQINKIPNFKTTLKEANSRANSIFS